MSIVDWIYPKMCTGCGREGSYICEVCRKKLITPPPICPMCCQPSIGGWVHPRCRKPQGLDRLIVGLPYRGPVQDALKNVKYKNAWDIVQNLFEIWSERIRGELNISSDSVITSVPMFARKERDRGFNQAEVFAQILGKSYQAPNLKLLERVRETKPMFGLSKKERKENVRGVFTTINQFTKISDYRRVILVDDVWTTGATCRECAIVLKRNGITQVIATTLAR